MRSWLKSISSTHFNQTLGYHKEAGGLTPFSPMYDGSITTMTWRTGNDTDVWGYRLRYYPTGWLRSTTTRLNGTRVHNYDTFYDYDKMGNMTGFYRWGVVDKDIDLYDYVDYPEITYVGNRPTRIDDRDYLLTYPYNNGYHFIDYVQQNNEYTYDQNGNLTQDLNKRISSIKYNLLNLPTNITYSTGSTIAYTYDAAGKKLQVEYGSPNKTIDYCSNMIYENDTLKQILVDGGYVTLSGSSPVYHYYLKDHQGNNRVVMSSSGTVEQINHYFPYGYLFGESTNSGTQRYKYNDKEFDMMHGLHWYDYGARHYDPCIMRFTTMDPMCEKYYHLSPYAYCGNNPVNYVDPTGEDPGDYFESMDLAALDFGKFYNALSINIKKELSSYIYITKDSWGNTAFSYTIPSIGKEDESTPTKEGMPKGGKIVGRVHSHSNWDEKYVTEAKDGNESFSNSDKEIYNRDKIFGYVTTPKGKMLKWDPIYKTSICLSNEMPQDPKTVNKGEKFIRTYKHSEGSSFESRRNSWYQEKYQETILNKIKSIFIKGK